MKIHGFQKLTLVDFPSHVAAILFTGACNFRCPFCHNSSLVLSPEKEPVVSNEEIFAYLEKRKGILDGVVVTGGEPTLQKDLIPFLGELKRLGYSVKLDTNGYRPEVLKDAMDSGFVDYVAMDIKNSIDSYPETAGLTFFNQENIIESASLLMNGKVDYEFRTTVVKELHREENFEKIGQWLKGAKRYYLQSFVPSENTIEKGFESPGEKALESYAEILRNYITNVEIRDL